jgi:uncharacterized membrane protein
MSQETGKWVIVFGLLIIIIGVIIYFLGDKLTWIGRLPGDIHIEREGFSLFIPIVTMLLFSIVLTLIFRLIRYFL